MLRGGGSLGVLGAVDGSVALVEDLCIHTYILYEYINPTARSNSISHLPI